jgi:predicted CoA-binding protein
MKKVAILGASNNSKKYGCKAVKAYLKRGFSVYPVNPNETDVQDLKSYKDILELPNDIDRITFYVPPEIGIKELDKVKKKGIKEVFINPGAESEELIKKAESLDLKLILSCSILDIGESPSDY